MASTESSDKGCDSISNVESISGAFAEKARINNQYVYGGLAYAVDDQ